MSQVMVRMGELAASAAPGELLVSLGLGSCIGLALVDRGRTVAGLAHVVLPVSDGRPGENPLKFADLAVPELLRRVVALGARPVRLEAVLVGGASMFGTSSNSLDVGQRNERAVRELLMGLRVPIAAAVTGGSKGRTIRVVVGAQSVTYREAGGADTEILAASGRVAAVVA
jgi:chemotaxis protein CheD